MLTNRISQIGYVRGYTVRKSIVTLILTEGFQISEVLLSAHSRQVSGNGFPVVFGREVETSVVMPCDKDAVVV